MPKLLSDSEVAAFRERGYREVELESETDNPIFQGLPKKITVWESHCDEVKDLPHDFIRTATNEVSTIPPKEWVY